MTSSGAQHIRMRRSSEGRRDDIQSETGTPTLGTDSPVKRDHRNVEPVIPKPHRHVDLAVESDGPVAAAILMSNVCAGPILRISRMIESDDLRATWVRASPAKSAPGQTNPCGPRGVILRCWSRLPRTISTSDPLSAQVIDEVLTNHMIVPNARQGCKGTLTIGVCLRGDLRQLDHVPRQCAIQYPHEPDRADTGVLSQNLAHRQPASMGGPCVHSGLHFHEQSRSRSTCARNEAASGTASAPAALSRSVNARSRDAPPGRHARRLWMSSAPDHIIDSGQRPGPALLPGGRCPFGSQYDNRTSSRFGLRSLLYLAVKTGRWSRLYEDPCRVSDAAANACSISANATVRSPPTVRLAELARQ